MDGRGISDASPRSLACAGDMRWSNRFIVPIEPPGSEKPGAAKDAMVLVIAHESSGGREDNDDRGRERKEDGEDKLDSREQAYLRLTFRP